jgi:multiple sugar transport system ATP-binding protein
VSHLSLDVADGEVLALVGPSGSGKTTVLRLIAGTFAPTDGEVRIDGRVANTMPSRERDLAMVSEPGSLNPYLDTAGNMGSGLRYHGVAPDETAQRVDAEARVLRLPGLLRRRVGQLSAGQRRRVELGRATVRLPRAFLLDEPLRNLDSPERTRLRVELGRLVRGLRVTTIYVTSNQAEALSVGDRVGVLRAGRLEQVDSPRSLYERPGNLFVAGFLGPAGLLPGRLRAATDPEQPYAIELEVAGVPLRMPAEAGATLRPLLGRGLVAVARPEDVRPAGGADGDGRLEATVAEVELHGADTVLTCVLDTPAPLLPDAEQHGDGRARILARFPGRDHPAPGERVALAPDPAALHLFDPATGTVVWHGV